MATVDELREAKERIDALTKALVEIWGITHDPSVERKIMAVMDMMASELTDAYDALQADEGDVG